MQSKSYRLSVSLVFLQISTTSRTSSQRKRKRPSYKRCDPVLVDAAPTAAIYPSVPRYSTYFLQPLTHSQIPAQRWTHLTHRRLQAHPSTLTKSNTLLASPLPGYLTNPVVQRFINLGIFDDTPHQKPNHVLINEYKPGEGIMPHEDGSAYARVVATVSLGSTLCLELTPKPTSEDATSNDDAELVTKYKLPIRILQEPRSLLITTGEAYGELMHGIAPIEVDDDLTVDTIANWSLLADPQTIVQAGGRNVREIRISLTYRDVLKVSSAANKVLGGLGRR
jgi:alkylated DNA repair protein alkB family protein 6